MKKDYQLFRRTTPTWVRLALASGFAIVLMVADGKARRLEPLRNVVGAALGLVQQPLQTVQSWVGDTFNHAYDLQRLALDNQKLTATNQEQAARITQLMQYERDNDALRAQLDLKTKLITPTIAARVLYQVVDPYARKLVLNKGSNDGIISGQPVITAQGLLGQITDVTPLTSELTLVLDTKMTVPVQLQNDPNVRGFISGHTNEGLLSLRFFSAEVPLKVDDVLVTSGKDGLYPEHLAVGRVSQIESAAENGQSSITVVPTAEGMSARYVLVLQVADVTNMAKRSKLQTEQVEQDAMPDTLGSRARAQAQEKQQAQGKK